ncbi:DUF5131 family protein, partial [Lacticaseibacillus rhamnosus]|uniref:DUF5131 family protein n=1 Tax=Lacticaseibacillus rhamnosus TaxID=47715 RepID=UPI0019527BAB
PHDFNPVTFPNVVLIATVCDQNEIDRDGPKLITMPARYRGFSIEPMLGEIDARVYLQLVDWVICGGESGPHGRPMHPAWARSLRDQCAAAGRAFHFKQWGEHVPAELRE